MYLTTDVKKKFFSEHGGSEANTGSAEAQIALFSYRINHLTEHLKRNRKDFGTQRSLIALVGKRRKLLNYLMNTDISRYRAIVAKLGLRK
jgi:small subunit ribosomal protein S15